MACAYSFCSMQNLRNRSIISDRKSVGSWSHYSRAATSSSECTARTATTTTKLTSNDMDTEIVGGREMARRAPLTLHSLSLQHVVQTLVPVDVVIPLPHSDIVSLICRLHDVFIVHILLIDSFSLTSTARKSYQSISDWASRFSLKSPSRHSLCHFGDGLRGQSLDWCTWQSDSVNRKLYKSVCITTNKPDTKSNHNRYPNHTTKQHTIVSIQLHID